MVSTKPGSFFVFCFFFQKVLETLSMFINLIKNDVFAYAPNIFIWYCLLSGLNEGKTQLIKRKLWKWIPTVIERAHSDQSPLWTVIVSVYQVDWQIMHIYKQHLKKTHTYHSLSSSVSLYLSKTQYIHTLAFDFPFKLQRVPRVTMRTGINLTKHQKDALST